MELKKYPVNDIDRRRFFTACASLGLAATLLPDALAAVSQGQEAITTAMMRQAEQIAGLCFSEQERLQIVKSLNRKRSAYKGLRNLHMNNAVPFPLYFDPVPQGKTLLPEKRVWMQSTVRVKKPPHIQDLAFHPITHLSALIRQKAVSATELAQMYLHRLQRYDPLLKCVVTLTADLALEQARRADKEIAAGIYRGPLHGIPWGVKDLFATKGIPTTWGLGCFKNRIIDLDATVVKKLEDAGAVLIAKLSSGELATGDRWFGGQTRNPWHPDKGSGGSSAGPASAVAAGLVGFAIGTETNQSLIGPAMACGTCGLRPTFGRVSRYGAMTVSWSYDKIGPMCRSAEDCAIVLDAVRGPDGMDRTVVDRPFHWDANRDIKKLCVGYVKSLFDARPQNEWMAGIISAHKQVLDAVAKTGASIVEIKENDHDELKRLTRLSSLGMMVEAAAAHEGLSLGENKKIFRHSDWPRRFRRARYVPAVDFIQANRARSLLIQLVDNLLQGVDVLIGRLTLSSMQSNLTGHPELTIPHGFDKNNMPVGVILTGRLFGESDLIALAHAYQQTTGYHRQHPNLP